MQYILLLLLPLLLFAKPFKVASYNVENLFDVVYTGTEYDEYSKKHQWTKEMVEIKLNHTAEVICDLDADILGLQEIENAPIFEQLQKRLKRVGCGYRYSAITSKRDATIQVALLSRFPLIMQKEIVVSSSPRVRNILEVEVEVDGQPLTLFVNHWKSKAYGGVESKRMKYATVLQKRINRLSKSKEYIILGDFNTDYDAYLSLEKKINDTGGRTGLHDILKIADGNYLIDEYQMFGNEKGVHYTLWQELTPNQRWSMKFYGKKGSPDHIILPRSMFDQKGIEYVNNTFGVFKAAYLFTKRGYINRWHYKNGKHRGEGYSDHLPIYASFDLKAYQPESDREVPHHKREVKNIAYFYTKESLENEVLIRDAVVLLKRRRDAVIKQRGGRGIFLYGCAGELEEGKRYDLLVKGMKTYKGLKELTRVYVLKEKGDAELLAHILSQDDWVKPVAQRQNEVIKNIVGIYKNRNFYSKGRKIPIYFKKRNIAPPNGSKLKIDYAHLGYYKKLQLVVYRKKDFEVLK